MKTNLILCGIVLSFIVSLYDIMSAIYIAVFTNTCINYIIISRQKKVVKKKVVKKSRPLTVDEFRDAECYRKGYYK